MNTELFKEDLSIAYLKAISAAAKISMELQHRDEDGKDIHLKKRLVRTDGVKIDVEIGVQLKATNSHNMYEKKKDGITYTLNIKNFHDLTMKSTIPKYLMLLILPEDENEWVSCNIEKLIIKKCMYWVKIENREMENTTSVRIFIPSDNIVTPDALNKILVATGEEL